MLARGDLEQAVTRSAAFIRRTPPRCSPGLGLEDEAAVLVDMEPAPGGARAARDGGSPTRWRSRRGCGPESCTTCWQHARRRGGRPARGHARGEATRLLRLFGREEAGELEELLAYGDESAGGLMTPDIVAVSPGRDRRGGHRAGCAPSPGRRDHLLRVRGLRRGTLLEGVLSLRELIVSPPAGRSER